MSTPPISQSDNKRVEGHELYVQFPSREPIPGQIVRDHPDVSVEIFTEFRPASHFVPKSSSGWRDPTGWFHNGSSMNVSPTSNTVLYEYGFIEGSDGNIYKYGILEYDGYAFSGSQLSQLAAFPSKLEDAAVNKALLAMASKRVNLSTNFVERQQAVDLATDAVHSIIASVRNFKNASPKNWGRLLKQATVRKEGRKIPEEWLKVQYGWKPLMDDVHGAVQLLNDREKDNDAYRATVYGRMTDRDVTTWRKTSRFTTHVFYDVTSSVTHHSLVRLDYTMRNPFLASLAQLGITNPADLVWEEIPWSFVVDWFLPVGNYLSAWDATLGWDFKAGTITRFSKQTDSSPNVQSDIGYATIVESTPYKAVLYSMSRSVLESSPSPRIPSFKNPLSSLHLSEALSLLAGVFHR